MSQEVSNDKFTSEDIEKVRTIFEKNDAMSKQHTITKELIMEDLIKEFGEGKAQEIFEYLKAERIIKKKSNKFYFSEKAQKSAWYRYGVTSIKTFAIVMLIAIILACVIIFGGDYFTSNNNNVDTQNTTSEDIIRETSYEVGVDDIVLEFPEDILVLTQDEITYYFGEAYASAYDCLAVSSDFSKMIMIFTDYKSNYEEEYTPEEYLKMSLDNEELEVVEKEISGHTFYQVEQTYEGSDGNTYVEQDMIYDAGDRYICMVFDSLESNQIDVETIIK